MDFIPANDPSEQARSSDASVPDARAVFACSAWNVAPTKGTGIQPFHREK
jgi:hypothetical protein